MYFYLRIFLLLLIYLHIVLSVISYPIIIQAQEAEQEFSGMAQLSILVDEPNNRACNGDKGCNQNKVFGTATLIRIDKEGKEGNEYRYIFATAYHVLAYKFKQFGISFAGRNFTVDEQDIFHLSQYDLSVFSIKHFDDQLARPSEISFKDSFSQYQSILKNSGMIAVTEFFKKQNPLYYMVHTTMFREYLRSLTSPWKAYQCYRESIPGSIEWNELDRQFKWPNLVIRGYRGSTNSRNAGIAGSKNIVKTGDIEKIDLSKVPINTVLGENYNAIGADHIFRVKARIYNGMSGGGVFLEDSGELIGIILYYDEISKDSYFLSYLTLLQAVKEYDVWRLQSPKVSRVKKLPYTITRAGSDQPRIRWVNGVTFRVLKNKAFTWGKKSFETAAGNEPTETGGNEPTETGGNEPTETDGNEPTETDGNPSNILGRKRNSFPVKLKEGVYIEAAGEIAALKPYEGKQIVKVGGEVISSINDLNEVLILTNVGLFGGGELRVKELDIDQFNPYKQVVTLDQAEKNQALFLKSVFQNIDWIGRGEKAESLNQSNSWGNYQSVGIRLEVQNMSIKLSAWNLSLPVNEKASTPWIESFSMIYEDTGLVSNQTDLPFLENTSTGERYQLASVGVYKYTFVNPKDKSDWIYFYFDECYQNIPNKQCLELNFARSLRGQQLIYSTSFGGFEGLANEALMLKRWYGSETLPLSFIDIFKTSTPITYIFQKSKKDKGETEITVTWKGKFHHWKKVSEYNYTIQIDGNNINVCHESKGDAFNGHSIEISKNPSVTGTKENLGENCILQARVQKEKDGYVIISSGITELMLDEGYPEISMGTKIRVKRVNLVYSLYSLSFEQPTFSTPGLKLLESIPIPLGKDQNEVVFKQMILKNGIDYCYDPTFGQSDSVSVVTKPDYNDSFIIKDDLRMEVKNAGKTIIIKKYNRGIFSTVPLTLGAFELWRRSSFNQKTENKVRVKR